MHVIVILININEEQHSANTNINLLYTRYNARQVKNK